MRNLSSRDAEYLSRQFDQSIEFEPYASDAQRNAAYEEVMPYLRIVDSAVLEAAMLRLPVFPAAAREVIQLAWAPETCLSELVRLAGSDPVLAGDVVASANSGRFGPRQPLGDLRRAVAHLGCDMTRDVLLAAAVRKTFDKPRFRAVWEHSLSTAESASRLARQSGCVPAGEAFLSGLLHDIGRLAFLTSSSAADESAKRLLSAGCPTAPVERVLYGVDHAELGARILAEWNFPHDMQDAARAHHRPEQARALHAPLVYLAEFRADLEEDLPSLARLQHSCKVAGISLSEVTGINCMN
jgi:putative nucleotidyltransferase with HDIG domain